MAIVLEMSAKLEEIDQLVVTLKASLEGAVSEDKLSAMEIAVTEALANAVNHGSSAERGEKIRVSAAISEDGVRVEIVDAGEQMPADLYDDVAELDEVDLMAESGRGLPLIRFCSDDLVYEPSEGRNRLELLFRREAPA
ncbi:ATP-binding protein [Mangrovicoccus sp. HB161399]|uniref:ATP-binding protein n=1 Tax=Mangrovicoccus sp. HB161399 TaxID=2720392 RepID=UPI001552BF5A|nr:ATP-binding protein [Mangrovicoccus sp. HB161399]